MKEEPSTAKPFLIKGDTGQNGSRFSLLLLECKERRISPLWKPLSVVKDKPPSSPKPYASVCTLNRGTG